MLIQIFIGEAKHNVTIGVVKINVRLNDYHCGQVTSSINHWFLPKIHISLERKRRSLRRKLSRGFRLACKIFGPGRLRHSSPACRPYTSSKVKEVDNVTTSRNIVRVVRVVLLPTRSLIMRLVYSPKRLRLHDPLWATFAKCIIRDRNIVKTHYFSPRRRGTDEKPICGVSRRPKNIVSVREHNTFYDFITV